MIIIPDVHGRTFWKDAVAQKEEGEKVIFLGDYLDPYMYEFTKLAGGYFQYLTEDERAVLKKVKTDAIENFKEIMEYKRSNPDDVVLLIGNHDCSYFFSKDICECRIDYDRYTLIRNLFKNNADLFQLAYKVGMEKTDVIISHAGIHNQYAMKCFGDKCNEENVVELFNDALAKNDQKIIRSLGTVSYMRGGWERYGSIVWADVDEWKEDYCEYKGDDEKNDKSDKPKEYAAYQIFGHSQQELKPIISEHVACLDCRRAFRVSDSGTTKPNIEAITPESIVC